MAVRRGDGRVLLQSLLFLIFTAFLIICQLTPQVSRAGPDPRQAPVLSLVPVDHLQSVYNQAGELVQIVGRQVVHAHMLPVHVVQNLLDEPLWKRGEQNISSSWTQSRMTDPFPEKLHIWVHFSTLELLSKEFHFFSRMEIHEETHLPQKIRTTRTS